MGAELILWTSASYIHIEHCKEDFPEVFSLIDHILDRSEITLVWEKGAENEDFQILKDLTRINRDLKRTILIDNDPAQLSWNNKNLYLSSNFNKYSI